MKAAEAKARRIVEQARAEASRHAQRGDDFCDKRLAQLETVLERTMTVIAVGRAKLRGPAGEGSPPTAAAGDAGSGAVAGPTEPDDQPAGLLRPGPPLTDGGLVPASADGRGAGAAIAWSPVPSPSRPDG